MNVKSSLSDPDKSHRWFRGAKVPILVIRQFARKLATAFHPEKIILFGSHAYGTPHDDSDVDILVIMKTRNELDQAFKIHSTLLPDFPLDIIVRSPSHWRWLLSEGDSFHTEVLTRGKTLYEKKHAPG